MPHHCTQSCQMAPSIPSTTSYLDSRSTSPVLRSVTSLTPAWEETFPRRTMCPDCAPPPRMVPRPQFLPCSVLSFTVLMFSFETIFSAPVMWWELDTAEAMVGSLCSRVWLRPRRRQRAGCLASPEKTHWWRHRDQGTLQRPNTQEELRLPMATGSGVERESSSKKNSL